MAEQGIAPTPAPGPDHHFAPPGGGLVIDAEPHVPTVPAVAEVPTSAPIPANDAVQSVKAEEAVVNPLSRWGIGNKNEPPSPVKSVQFAGAIGVTDASSTTENPAQEPEQGIHVGLGDAVLPPDIHDVAKPDVPSPIAMPEPTVPSESLQAVVPTQAEPRKNEHGLIEPTPPDFGAAAATPTPDVPAPTAEPVSQPDTTASAVSATVDTTLNQGDQQVASEIPTQSPVPDAPSVVSAPEAQSTETPALNSVPEPSPAPEPVAAMPPVSEASQPTPATVEPTSVVETSPTTTELPPVAPEATGENVPTPSAGETPAASSSENPVQISSPVPSVEAMTPSAPSVETTSSDPVATIPEISTPVVSETSSQSAQEASSEPVPPAPTPDETPFKADTTSVSTALEEQNVAQPSQPPESPSPAVEVASTTAQPTAVEATAVTASDAVVPTPSPVETVQAVATPLETPAPEPTEVQAEVATQTVEATNVEPFPQPEASDAKGQEAENVPDATSENEKIMASKLLDQALPAMGLGQAMMILSGDPKVKELADVIGDKINELTKDDRKLGVDDIKTIPHMLTMAGALIARSMNPASRDEKKNCLNAANVLIGLHFVQKAQESAPTMLGVKNSGNTAVSDLPKAA